MWEKEHEDKTCEEFEAWKIMQDPHIAKLIQLTGIECPKCHMNYQLVRGGCLHFTCHQCKFEFCGGCSQPIYIKDVCPMGCEGLGLHAHHPRDCLYFLRDWNVETLEKLLTNHEVKLEAENEIPVEEENPKQCNVILAESLDGEEKQCGKPYFKSDLCEIHYKEYLIHLINKNKLDPATLMDINSMELCLKRMRCPLLTRTSTEDDAAYQPRILAYLQQQLPIIAAATVQQDENNQQEGDAEPAEVADA
jgi:E3 ubiquitin-protein ligase RNF31